MTEMPVSILDNDLYKFTMQQAVMLHFPNTMASYKFTNRNRQFVFTRACVEEYQRIVQKFKDVRLTEQEEEYLKDKCAYLKPEYLSFLRSYIFDPSQVSITFTPTGQDAVLGEVGDVNIQVHGLWVQTILWEVPLMASLSECYFKMIDTDWDYEGQEEKAYEKTKTLLLAECAISEFGTRRRRSYKTQDTVIGGIKRAEKDCQGHGLITGTSNVHFAMKYGYGPVGTIAHEWFMGVAALTAYEGANDLAMRIWEQVYPYELRIALTDTFSTEAFFQNFAQNAERAKAWRGLRQDSGDPFIFAPRAKKVYEQLGVPHHDKVIVYSDGLDVDKVLELKKHCAEYGFISSFGIGTSYTNDYRKKSSGGKEKSKALNIVIKLSTVDGQPCVKISDELTKNTGDASTVSEVKRIFGLPEK